MFGLREARIISVVARSGGFRAASSELTLAPSAISARVAQLERALGARLFERSRRGATLTPAGRRFLEKSERLLSMRDEIVADFSHEDGPAGALRIGAAETIVHTAGARALTDLAAYAPRMRIELTVDISERLARALVNDEIDIAVLLRQWAPRTAETIPTPAIAMSWYAAPSLADEMRAANAMSLEGLSGRSVITFTKGTPPAREVERILADPFLNPPTIHGSSSLATVAHLTRAAFGVGTLPDDLAAQDVADGALQRLDFGEEARLSELQFDIAYIASSLAPFAAALGGGA